MVPSEQKNDKFWPIFLFLVWQTVFIVFKIAFVHEASFSLPSHSNRRSLERTTILVSISTMDLVYNKQTMNPS